MRTTERGNEKPVALVTGCSSGIGRATALHLAKQGWCVFATSRRVQAMSDIASDSLVPIRLDVTDESSRAAAVETALARAGHIDALINNAGYSDIGPLEDATAEQIRAQFETNTFGPLRLAQLVLPAMREQGAGRIVNVSTIGGRVSMPFLGLYSGSKFALEALSDALRVETRPFGVNVIIIEPGSTKTNFSSVAAHHAYRFSSDSGSRYSKFFAGFSTFVSRSATRSSTPEHVARVIHRALTARHPRARYPATPQARIMLGVLPRLSDKLRDALWRQLMNLPDPSKS